MDTTRTTCINIHKPCILSTAHTCLLCMGLMINIDGFPTHLNLLKPSGNFTYHQV
jgi:hypothetical protein